MKGFRSSRGSCSLLTRQCRRPVAPASARKRPPRPRMRHRHGQRLPRPRHVARPRRRHQGDGREVAFSVRPKVPAARALSMPAEGTCRVGWQGTRADGRDEGRVRGAKPWLAGPPGRAAPRRRDGNGDSDSARGVRPCRCVTGAGRKGCGRRPFGRAVRVNLADRPRFGDRRDEAHRRPAALAGEDLSRPKRRSLSV